MTIKLRELIKTVRQCKTAAKERTKIAKECAIIRTSFKENQEQYRHRNIAKLLFIHMLGYPTHFGQMECLKLIATNSFRNKRMGYLGLMLLLDERQEVLMLVTNSLQNDLNHRSPHVQGLALCSLANIASEGMARDLAPDVIKLLGSHYPYVKKKAALCAVKILRKCPELLDQFVPKIKPLLVERNHGVLITTVTLIIEMCNIDNSVIEHFRKFVQHIVKILKSLVLSGYAPEHDVNGITDPFLQVKVLRLMRLLANNSQEATDAMNDILAQVATNTENVRNVGNAILYECVQTIMSIPSATGLRVLAINILGRFLLNKDNNIRYVALNTLHRVVSIDQQAVQRHRKTVVACLKDHDISIRKRALDLTYALVNTQNIKDLVKELIGYLRSADLEFRSDIVARICMLTENHAPSPKWHFDTILKVIQMAGNYIQPDVIANTIQLLLQTPDLQNYAVHKLFAALSNDILKQPLTQLAVWSVGEFGDLILTTGKLNIQPKDIINLFDKILKSPASSLVTREIVLTALVKLHQRLSEYIEDSDLHEDILSEFDLLRSSLSVELQQRSCEYYVMVSGIINPSKLAEVLDIIPPLETGGNEEEEEEEEYEEEAEIEEQYNNPNPSGSLLTLIDNGPANNNNNNNNKEPTNLLNDLLSTPVQNPVNNNSTPSGNNLINDLLGGPVATPAVNNPAPSGNNLINDLLGGPVATPVANNNLIGIANDNNNNNNNNLLSNPNPIVNNASPVVNNNNNKIPDMVAFDKNGIKVLFKFQKNPQNPALTLIGAIYTNSAPLPLNNFSFKIAIPPYLKMQDADPTGTTLAANNANSITQQFQIYNTMHGQQPFVLKIRVSFQANGQEFSTDATLSTFPPGI